MSTTRGKLSRCANVGCTASLYRGAILGVVGGMLFLLSISAFSQTNTCGVTWNAPVRISTDSLPSFSPRVAVTGDTIHVFWFGLDTLGTVGGDGIEYSHSFDGGATFTSSRSLVSMDTASPPVFIATSEQFVYAVFFASIDTFYGSVLIRSSDAGISWGPVTLLGKGLQPQCIAASGPTIYVQLINPRPNVPNPYSSARSNNYGATWSRSGSPALQVVVPGSNYFHALSVEPSERSNEVGYYVSENFGATWFGPEYLSREDPIPSELPSLAVNEKENLFAIWNDGGTIVMRRSKDRGFSWSSQVQIAGGGGALLSEACASREFVSVAWDNNLADGIHFRGSNDFAGSFCGVDSPVSTMHAGEPAIAISNNHLHLVCWEEVGGVDREIFYRRGELTGNPDLSTIPKTYVLRQNYPNPFNGTTVIEYDLPRASTVRLALYNVLGERVATLIDEFQPASRYKIPFEGGELPTGLYFYQLKTESVTEIKKLLIVR